MHRSKDVIRPKTKIRVELQKDDGSLMIGHVFVGGQERILDLLNSKERFIPFEHEDGRYVMINKEAIAYVWPDDNHWMSDTFDAAPKSQSSAYRRVP
jgi:hypothetical protein